MNDGEGIYFHPETAALSRVDDSLLDLSSGWVRVSEDVSLGLVEARKRIEELGLSDDTRGIDWLEMAPAGWEQQRRVSSLIRDFKRDSEGSREMAQEKPGILHRLMAGLGSFLPLRSH